MKHVLCAHLHHWPIDRLRRRRAELRHKPLVLVETSGNRQTVVSVSPETPEGIVPGMALAAARARHATLIDLPATPEVDLRSLEALGHWLMRFSPSVCVYPPASLFLDATGMERLFGDFHTFHQRVAQAFDSLRITVGIAIAPTPGAAWALAAFGGDASLIAGAGRPGSTTSLSFGCQSIRAFRPRLLKNREDICHALSSLPPQALRLEHSVVEQLFSLGVETIGSLLRLSRDDLVVRLGSGILQRIDQAKGDVPEPLTFLPHRSPIRASLEFEFAIQSMEAIHLVVQELVREISRQLAARGLGARDLRLTLRQPYAGSIEKSVRLMRPCRNELALFKLICCAIENLEAHEGFVMVNLKVAHAQRLGDEQVALMGGEEERDAVEVDHLVERLRARLNDTVEWGKLAESNLPEHAYRYLDNVDGGEAKATTSIVSLFRPLRLLRQPRAITAIVQPLQSAEGQPVSFTDRGEVHQLDHIRGPERITGQWWKRRSKIRDYFDVLDSAGDRYWIFRVAQTRRWFLHGTFE